MSSCKSNVYNSPVDIPLLCIDTYLYKYLKEDIGVTVPKGSLENVHTYPLLNLKVLLTLHNCYDYKIDKLKCVPYTLRPNRSTKEFVSLMNLINEELLTKSDMLLIKYEDGESFSNDFMSSSDDLELILCTS